MNEPASDMSLLRAFGTGRSEDAFGEIARRYVKLVYSAAVRQVRDRHLAEDVTQAVFVILARKAARLPSDTVLGAWLWQVTRYTARAAVRRERRLKARERRKAADLASASDHRGTDGPSADQTGAASWAEIGPLLDDAVARLGERDRRAIVLRFFEGRSLREVGDAMGTSEDAAKQRVLRALAKLRGTLAARRGGWAGGATATAAAALGKLLTDHAATAAPPIGLAEAAANGAAHAHVAAEVGAIAKGAMAIMTYAKIKTAAVIAAVLVALLAGSSIVAMNALRDRGSSRRAANGQASSPGPATTAKTTAAQTAAPNGDWRARFNAVYRLGGGDVLKRVAPPFIAERENFLSAMDPRRRLAVSNAGYRFGWNGAALAAVAGPMQAQTLASTLSYTLGVPAYRVEFGDLPRGMRLSGDWVVRDGSTDDERLTALAGVLARDWNLGIRFERRRVSRDVLVARGRWTAAAGTVVCLYETNDAQGRGTVEGDGAKFLASLADLLDEPVVDDVAPPVRPQKVEWRYGPDVQPGAAVRPDAIDAILSNVARQTGLAFTRETREVEVWSIQKN